MRHAGIYEVKQHLSDLIAAVEAGEEVCITRHGRPVARLVPMQRKPVITEAQLERELRALRTLHREIRPGPGWRELRDEGRE